VEPLPVPESPRVGTAGPVLKELEAFDSKRIFNIGIATKKLKAYSTAELRDALLRYTSLHTVETWNCQLRSLNSKLTSQL
jgi:hypothetical protein